MSTWTATCHWLRTLHGSWVCASANSILHRCHIQHWRCSSPVLLCLNWTTATSHLLERVWGSRRLLRYRNLLTYLQYLRTYLLLPRCHLDRLQSAINASARLTVGLRRHDHISHSSLWSLWTFTGCGCLSVSSTGWEYWFTTVYTNAWVRTELSAEFYQPGRERRINLAVVCTPRHQPIWSFRRHDVQLWVTAPSLSLNPGHAVACWTQSVAFHRLPFFEDLPVHTVHLLLRNSYRCIRKCKHKPEINTSSKYPILSMQFRHNL